MPLKKITKLNYIIISSVLMSLFYSVLRYNVFKDVSWTELPLYVFNKAISLASVILFVLYQILRKRLEIGQRNLLKDYAVVLAITHVVISIVILSPEYYEKFYSSYKLNLTGNLTILFGIVAFIAMFVESSKYFFRRYVKSRSILKSIWIAFILFLILHVVIMGGYGWLSYENWPGGLPPITLLSFILLFIGLLARLVIKK